MQQSYFDTCPNRRGTNSYKWDYFDEDKLPMWVADMDFRSPEPVIRALRERVEHGVFGYTAHPPQMKGLLVERMQRLYNWTITEEDILFVPGVVLGFNLAIQAITRPGEGILIQPPVYGPFLLSGGFADCSTREAPLKMGANQQYEIDFDEFEATIENDVTRAFLFCNPHNPGGRVYRKDELTQIADICLKNDLTIVSDEIHCDLVFKGHKHIPIASLSPEIAARSITVMAPSKTFNIAGLGASFMIVQNPDLREKIRQAQKGIIAHVDLLAYTAMHASYTEGQEWLDALLIYLEGNRDYIDRFVKEELPGVKCGLNEATYLAWLDCRESGIWTPSKLDKDIDPYLIRGSMQTFFLEKANVAMNSGLFFGAVGDGFVRLNFGCPRSHVEEALQRMKTAWKNVKQ